MVRPFNLTLHVIQKSSEINSNSLMLDRQINRYNIIVMMSTP